MKLLVSDRVSVGVLCGLFNEAAQRINVTGEPKEGKAQSSFFVTSSEAHSAPSLTTPLGSPQPSSNWPKPSTKKEHSTGCRFWAMLLRKPVARMPTS